MFYSYSNPRHVQASTTMLNYLLCIFRLHLFCSYLRTRRLSQNSLFLLKILHGFLHISLSPLLVLIFILGLVVPSLILFSKQALYIILCHPFSLLILHCIISHFLVSISTSIAFITFFRIILLLI